MEIRKSAGRTTRGGRGERFSRSSSDPEVPPEELSGWIIGRLPEGWFEHSPTVTIDHDEILIVGRLVAPDLGGEVEPAAKSAAESGRITRFREETREERMTIAREGQQRFGRTISWGAEIGDTKEVFTNLSIPVMTRLRQSERTVLDTLVDSGVARSRSDALAWCVKLVGANADEWLLRLRKAMESVETVRREGPLA
ncbi:MAG TPA: hypothetical protein VGP11_06030 [Acidimicrobiales bacterium]|jgi:hypothetical protein|nr:hypothetical protein [Acidimicrobiales bacterium]